MSVESDVAQLQRDMRRALATVAALQGQPADATLSIPHNDSWLFEDNVDSTHAGNLRYVISANVQRVVSARLSIHLAPYRTYSNFSVTSTGTESAGHNHSHAHTSAAHAHDMFKLTSPVITSATQNYHDGAGGGGNGIILTVDVSNPTPLPSFSATPGNTGSDASGESATHTHTVGGSSFLGITEGATAAAVTVAFDGVDATANLGGPFNVDAIELNVLPYLAQTKGVFHAITMTPSGLGRLEAHLRLGVYVAAGSQF